MEQRELVERARRGDGAAFAALVGSDLIRMVRLAAAVSGNSNDAEDIVQESMTRALRALKDFDSAREFRPWFATIVANQARNWRRGRGRRQRLTQRIAAQVAPVATPVDDHAILLEESSRVQQSLLSLDESDREVLALRFLAGLTESESAESLGVPLGTIKSRTSRALAKLRVVMEKEHSYGH